MKPSPSALAGVLLAVETVAVAAFFAAARLEDGWIDDGHGRMVRVGGG